MLLALLGMGLAWAAAALLRRPDPEWVGLDTSVSFGPDGVGLTSTVLNDVHGPVGTAAQSLTLRLP